MSWGWFLWETMQLWSWQLWIGFRNWYANIFQIEIRHRFLVVYYFNDYGWSYSEAKPTAEKLNLWYAIVDGNCSWNGPTQAVQELPSRKKFFPHVIIVKSELSTIRHRQLVQIRSERLNSIYNVATTHYNLLAGHGNYLIQWPWKSLKSQEKEIEIPKLQEGIFLKITLVLLELQLQ